MNLRKLNLSDNVKNELKRLQESKNPKHRQRYDAIHEGIMRACLNPKNVDNIPNELKPYWVEKVGGQIRLFYEMIGADVLHFSWVNNEECLHDTNNGQENDPCYKEFSRLYHSGKLPKYAPKVEPEGSYQQKALWGSEAIYAFYKDQSGFADCHMLLEPTPGLHYKITHLSSSSFESTHKRKLLSEVVATSKPYGASFNFELCKGVSLNEFHSIRPALIENKFELVKDFGDGESWVYRHSK
jgi:hypothetical protein